MLTPEEIKNLIDTKIAGQGSMVDVGGALPTILKEIVDKIPTQVPDPAILPVYLTETSGVSKEELAHTWGITTEQLDKFIRGDYVSIRDLATARTYLVMNILNLEDSKAVAILDVNSTDGAFMAYNVYQNGDEYGMNEV
jgi:hypothetical protein